MSNNGHFAIKSISGGNSSHSRSQKSLHPITLQDFGNNYVLVPVHTKDTTISKKQIKELTNIYQYKETKGNSFVLYNKQSPTTRIAVPYYYARNHVTHGKSNIEIMNFYPQSTFYSTPPVGQFVAGNSARLTSVEDNILQSLIVFPELPGNEIYTGTYSNVSTKNMINSNSASSVHSTNDINNSITSPSYSVNSINNKSKINTTTVVNNRSVSNQYNNSYSNTYSLLHTNSKSQSRYVQSNTTSNYNTHSSGTSSMYGDNIRYKNDKKGTNMNYSLSNSITSTGIQTNNNINNNSDSTNCSTNTNNKLNLENNNTNDSTISVNNCTNSNSCLQKSHSSTMLNSFNLSKSNSSTTFAYSTTNKNNNSNNNMNDNNNNSNTNHTMNSNTMNMNSLSSYNYTLKNKRSTTVASSSACTWTTLTTTTASPLPSQTTPSNSDITNTNKGVHMNVSSSPLSTSTATTTTTTTQAFECNHLPKRYKSEREAYSNITNPTTFKECRTLLKSIFECIQKTGSIRVENITSLFPKNIQQIDKLLNILYNLRILVFMKDIKNVNDKGIYMINSKEIPISPIDISTLSKDLLSLQEENRKAEERIVLLKQALEDPQSNPMTLYSSIVEKYPSQYLSEPLYSILNKLLNDNSENMS